MTLYQKLIFDFDNVTRIAEVDILDYNHNLGAYTISYYDASGHEHIFAVNNSYLL